MKDPRRLASVAAVVVAAVAGVAAAVAPFLQQGLVFGGSACGGGGDEQRCTGIAREISILEASPRAWAFVAGGVLCVILATAVYLLRRRDSPAVILAAVLLAAVSLAGLVQMEQVDEKLGPSSGGTWGRTLEEWGPFLSPELADLQQDSLRRYAGTRTEPGGPLYDREQILPSFSLRERTGWSLLSRSVVVLFFAALFTLASFAVTSLPLAATIAGTVGLLAWAVVTEEATVCAEGASECYEGLLTIVAGVLVALWWAVYLAGIAIGRRISARR